MGKRREEMERRGWGGMGWCLGSRWGENEEGGEGGLMGK